MKFSEWLHNLEEHAGQRHMTRRKGRSDQRKGQPPGGMYSGNMRVGKSDSAGANSMQPFKHRGFFKKQADKDIVQGLEDLETED